MQMMGHLPRGTLLGTCQGTAPSYFLLMDYFDNLAPSALDQVSWTQELMTQLGRNCDLS
jgi:hypothetical protein